MKEKILSILFVTILILFLILGIVTPDKSVSVEERRKLKLAPEFSINSLFDGSYFNNLSDYLVEQFPLRRQFRTLKGFIVTKILNKSEDNGVFIKDGKIYQLNDNINEKSIEHILNLIQNVTHKYDIDTNLYYSIIPDKNYYLKDETIPKLEYSHIVSKFNDTLKNMEYIDIFESLNLDAYYDTDIHWKQEKLSDVLMKLEKSMNLKHTDFPSEQYNYTKFYGALYGQIASNLKPDTLTYLRNDVLDNARVYNFEKDKYERVYEEENLKNIDSYDVFLSGATPLLIIENDEIDYNRELIIFRDSFGSSLIPLLIPNYSKITVIDLRYMKSDYISKIDIIDFTNADDVMFLYSIPILNDSFTLN